MRTQRSGNEGNLEDLVRSGRYAGLTRRELLGWAAAGFAVGTPTILAACAGSADTPSSGADAPSTGPSGTMRIGMPFGEVSSLDPHLPPGAVSRLRNWNVFDGLLEFNNAGELVPALAEEVTPNADATEWTIRIKSDVTFHDGSALTADDVLYSFRRILDPATEAEARQQIDMIDAGGMAKVDNRTIRIPLKYAFWVFPEQLAMLGTIAIVKDGTNSFSPPIGTGAFTFDSGSNEKFTLKGNPNYWRSGLPRLSVVEVINIQDPTARLNALRSGQLDAIHPVEPSQVEAANADPKINVFTNHTGTFMPMYMDVSKRPFNDNRVREALKFATDREQMNQLAYGGEGRLGNDMFGALLPGYPEDIEQRPYDPERAQALWKQAGMVGSKLEFWTSDVWPGQLTHATAFAQQAKAAGIDVTLRNIPVDQYFTKAYSVQPFASDYWYTTPALGLMSLAFVPKSAYFDVASWSNPRTTQLYQEAVKQPDEEKRNDMVREILLEFRDTGPYIVWAFEASSDLYSERIGGQENSAIRGLNGFNLEKFFVKS